MSQHLDDEDDDLRSSQDRELTLSTTAILGIFFGLVLLCGLFFAFGYNMGSHHNSPGDSTEPSAPSSSSTPSTSFNSFKPAAGSPAASSGSGTTSSAPAISTSPPQTASTPTERSSEPAAHAPIIVVDHSTAPPSPAPAVANGSFVVQVAAVSPTHQEEADMLVSDLHSKGYAVAAHTSPADQLIHIQVGPFTNRPAAEAMRQRLQTDGFNAIIK